VLRKRAIAAALAVFGVALTWCTGAEAALTDLTVRIEGAQKTLFEGPIKTDGHQVRAFSDSAARGCDATNNGANPDPGPTPTAASVDAMELIGRDFDGEWYPGFDDYFIQRWGPDAEDAESFAYWGVLVNGMLTPVGGCQYLAEAGDEVLWAYDAFNGRQLLWLAAADDPADAATAPSPTASVEVNQPLALRVEAGERPNLSPASGVTVAPVTTASGSGFQTVETGSAAAVTTASAGHASITFSTPGWHRIKAQEETGFIRSNRLDVCVEPIGGGSCGPPLADTAVRVPPRYSEPPGKEGGGEQPPSGGNSVGGGASAARPPAAEDPAKPTGAVSLRRPTLDRRHGTAALKVLVPGAGRLAVTGPRIVNQKLTTTGAKLATVAIKPTASAREELLAKSWLRVALQVKFTPLGGEPSLQSRGLTLKLGAAGG
jgi:hypothetical protein